MRSALSVAAFVILFCVAAFPVQAQGNLAGTPQGKVGSPTTRPRAKLEAVYATIDPAFSEPGKDHLRVVLSDAPVPAAAASDEFALQNLTKDRKLHAVVLIISPAKQVRSALFFDAAIHR